MYDNRRPKRPAASFRDERKEQLPEQDNEGQIEGRNALTEALRSGRTIDKVFIADGEIDAFQHIVGTERLLDAQHTQ